MSFQHGAGFRVCGAVLRRNIVPSGKCAFLTLDVIAHPRSKKIEFKAFAREMIDEIAELGAGQTVEVTGQIDMETVKSRDRKDVTVDGRAKWVPALVVKAIKIEGSSVRPPAANGAAPAASPPLGVPSSSWDDEGPSDLDDDRIF